MRKPPQYRLHKPSQQAVVTLHGKDHYLGHHGSPESWQKYHRLLLQYSTTVVSPASVVQAVSIPESSAITINELILRYWRHAQTYYVKNGQPTSELDCLRHALGFLRRVAGSEAACLFGPRMLKSVRDAMLSHPILRKRRDPHTGLVHREEIARGLARKVINKHISRIKRLFRWAVEEEILPVTVHQALLTVQGLRRGRNQGRERPRIRPVSDNDFQAVLPHLSPMLATMVQIHRLCGCRSQDILNMRSTDIDQNKRVWEYRPAHYKTEHLNDDNNLDQERVIYLGPKAQALLKPWLLENPLDYIFSPKRAVAARNHMRRLQRQVPLWPSHRHRNEAKRKEISAIRDCYDDNSYRRAVQRACLKAGVATWTPKRLRHSRLTEIRHLFGLEASKACAGHKEIGVTQHYAEQDKLLASRVMEDVG